MVKRECKLQDFRTEHELDDVFVEQSVANLNKLGRGDVKDIILMDKVKIYTF